MNVGLLAGTGAFDGVASRAPARVRQASAPLEDAITQVFETVLGVSGLGPEDDFFALGGTSLLGAQLTIQLEALLSRPVPLVLLFQEATPRSMAYALADYPSNSTQHSILLQPGHGAVSIFCSPDFWGLPLSYIGLSRRLAPAYPVYGLTPGPLRAEMIRRPSIGLLTRAYRGEIKRRQPQGPYVISGYSAGAIPAFDLACQLEAEGERVLLVLLDPMINRGLPSLPFLNWWWREYVRPRTLEVGWWRAIRELQRLRNSLLPLQRIVTPLNGPRGVPREDRRLARQMLQAQAGWRCRPFHGPVMLAQISSRKAAEVFIDHDGMNGWRGLLRGKVQKLNVPTDHMGLMREPHVSDLSNRLSPTISDFIRDDFGLGGQNDSGHATRQ